MLDFQHSPILSPNYLKCKLPSAPTIMTTKIRSNFATTKKCLSERPKPQTHSVNLEAIPELVPYISKEKINLHSHFYITTNGSAVSMQKKFKSFMVEATRLQQLLLIRDIPTNISASKTLSRSVLSHVCQEQGARNKAGSQGL